MSNKVAIVTGAGNGIGLSIVTQLLNSPEVSHVVGVDLNTAKLESLQQTHRDQLHVVTGDVSQQSTNIQAVELALKHGKHLNAIVLNAGVNRSVGPLPTLSVDDWKSMFDVNFFALLHLIKAAWPYLLETEGDILMTSSGVSLAPAESWTPYACTKSSLNYLVSCLPLEEPRIKAISITPGAVDTNLQTEIRMNTKKSKATTDFLNGFYNENRLLKPEQPASAFVKLVKIGIPARLTGKTVSWEDVVKAH